MCTKNPLLVKGSNVDNIIVLLMRPPVGALGRRDGFAAEIQVFSGLLKKIENEQCYSGNKSDQKKGERKKEQQTQYQDGSQDQRYFGFEGYLRTEIY